ncbi:MAG: hypothetical protein HC904_15605 [Blastochloris sp.]|nr:hypothetical protein [Blastochloris sp.]
MRWAELLGLGLFWAWSLSGAEVLISATDADGVERVMNPKGMVTVLIYSNPVLQNRTREASKAVDEFKGRRDFRSIVVVDLRGTMADWAAGYTVRRMVRDLDQEALRVAPYYRKNGNPADPRKELSAIADFKGELCVKLGWTQPKDELRVMVFNREGKRGKVWEDLVEPAQLTAAVQALY